MRGESWWNFDREGKIPGMGWSIPDREGKMRGKGWWNFWRGEEDARYGLVES